MIHEIQHICQDYYRLLLMTIEQPRQVGHRWLVIGRGSGPGLPIFLAVFARPPRVGGGDSDLVAIERANLREIFSLLEASRSNPSSDNCSVREGAQKPSMAAMARRWDLSRDLLWPTEMLELQTTLAISRWVLPSDFQKSTSVLLSTSRALILLRAHIVFLAQLIICYTCASHRRSNWTWNSHGFLLF